MNHSATVPKHMLSWIQGVTIFHRTSDVNRLRQWRMHIRTSYVCPMVFYMMYSERRVLLTSLSQICARPPLCFAFYNSAPMT